MILGGSRGAIGLAFAISARSALILAEEEARRGFGVILVGYIDFNSGIQCTIEGYS